MRSKLVMSSLLALALGGAGCGSGSSRSAGGSSAHATGGPSAARAAGPVRIYRLTLTGKAETPAGAPSGTGAAVIAFHGSSLLCWRFAHLHGFVNATVAHIHIGAPGKSGHVVQSLSTGSHLHHQGCVHMSGALVKAIERNPRGYYVNVDSARYPNGAVRAQLRG